MVEGSDVCELFVQMGSVYHKEIGYIIVIWCLIACGTAVVGVWRFKIEKSTSKILIYGSRGNRHLVCAGSATRLNVGFVVI